MSLSHRPAPPSLPTDAIKADGQGGYVLTSNGWGAILAREIYDAGHRGDEALKRLDSLVGAHLFELVRGSDNKDETRRAVAGVAAQAERHLVSFLSREANG